MLTLIVLSQLVLNLFLLKKVLDFNQKSKGLFTRVTDLESGVAPLHDVDERLKILEKRFRTAKKTLAAKK